MVTSSPREPYWDRTSTAGCEEDEKGEVWEKARQTMQRLMSIRVAKRIRLDAFSLKIINISPLGMIDGYNHYFFRLWGIYPLMEKVFAKQQGNREGEEGIM